MPDQLCDNPRLPSGGSPDVGNATGVLSPAHGGTGADLSNGSAARVLATPPGANGAVALRQLAAEHLPTVSGVAGVWTAPTITFDAHGRAIAVTDGVAGGPATIQGTNAAGQSIDFAAELFIGPGNSFSYTRGSVSALTATPFASTIDRVWFRTDVSGVNLTVRLRSSDGTELHSGTLTAGQTHYDSGAISVAVTAWDLVWLSVTPASGTPNIANWYFGWRRKWS